MSTKENYNRPNIEGVETFSSTSSRRDFLKEQISKFFTFNVKQRYILTAHATLAGRSVADLALDNQDRLPKQVVGPTNEVVEKLKKGLGSSCTNNPICNKLVNKGERYIRDPRAGKRYDNSDNIVYIATAGGMIGGGLALSDPKKVNRRECIGRLVSGGLTGAVIRLCRGG